MEEETMEPSLLCAWPENIRRRMLAPAEAHATLTPAALSGEIISARPAPRATSNGLELAVPLDSQLMPTLARIEREMIKVALREHRGKVDAAARALGIMSPTTTWAKLRRRGELSDAIQHFQQAVQLRPDWAPALTDLAWLLATAPDDTLRDGDQAIRLAERAADLTGRRDAGALDALAAAYAAAGLFDRALETTQAAVHLNSSGPIAAAIRERQELYRAHKPYREPVGPLREPPPVPSVR